MSFNKFPLEVNTSVNVPTVETLTATDGAIPVGSHPQPMALARNTLGDLANYIYVGDFVDGTITVIDSSNNTVLETVSLGGETTPVQIVFNSQSSKGYVTTSSNSVIVIGSGNNIITELTGFTSPSYMAVADTPGYIYVSNTGTGDVKVIDNTETVIATINVGGSPLNMVANEYLGGTKVYVSATDDGDSISVIQTSNNTVLATVPVGVAPRGMCLSQDNSLLFVCNTGDNTLSIIQTSDNTVVHTVILTDPATQPVAVDNTYVYTVDESGGNVNRILTSNPYTVDTLSVVGIVNSSGTGIYQVQSLAFGFNNNHLYLGMQDGTVAVIQVSNFTLQTPITASSTAVSTSVLNQIDSKTLYFANTSSHVLNPINTEMNIPITGYTFTLTSDSSDFILVDTAAGPATINLPDLGTVTAGSSFSIVNFVFDASTTDVLSLPGQYIMSGISDTETSKTVSITSSLTFTAASSTLWVITSSYTG